MDTGLTRDRCRMVEEEKRERDNDGNVLPIHWWVKAILHCNQDLDLKSWTRLKENLIARHVHHI